jgi:diacylglycerol O-acyltransferase / wax synthase
MPNALGLFAKGYARAWLNPVQQMRVAAGIAPGLVRAVKGLINKDFSVEPAIQTPRTRFNVAVSPNRVVDGRSLVLSDIKALRALSPGAKINDVFLAIIGGSLRRYLIAKNDLPATSLTAIAR